MEALMQITHKFPSATHQKHTCTCTCTEAPSSSQVMLLSGLNPWTNVQPQSPVAHSLNCHEFLGQTGQFRGAHSAFYAEFQTLGISSDGQGV